MVAMNSIEIHTGYLGPILNTLKDNIFREVKPSLRLSKGNRKEGDGGGRNPNVAA